MNGTSDLVDLRLDLPRGEGLLIRSSHCSCLILRRKLCMPFLPSVCRSCDWSLQYESITFVALLVGRNIAGRLPSSILLDKLLTQFDGSIEPTQGATSMPFQHTKSWPDPQGLE